MCRKYEGPTQKLFVTSTLNSENVNLISARNMVSEIRSLPNICRTCQRIPRSKWGAQLNVQFCVFAVLHCTYECVRDHQVSWTSLCKRHHWRSDQIVLPNPRARQTSMQLGPRKAWLAFHDTSAFVILLHVRESISRERNSPSRTSATRTSALILLCWEGCRNTISDQNARFHELYYKSCTVSLFASKAKLLRKPRDPPFWSCGSGDGFFKTQLCRRPAHVQRLRPAAKERRLTARRQRKGVVCTLQDRSQNRTKLPLCTKCIVFAAKRSCQRHNKFGGGGTNFFVLLQQARCGFRICRVDFKIPCPHAKVMLPASTWSTREGTFAAFQDKGHCQAVRKSIYLGENGIYCLEMRTVGFMTRMNRSQFVQATTCPSSKETSWNQCQTCSKMCDLNLRQTWSRTLNVRTRSLCAPCWSYTPWAVLACSYSRSLTVVPTKGRGSHSSSTLKRLLQFLVVFSRKKHNIANFYSGGWGGCSFCDWRLA